MVVLIVYAAAYLSLVERRVEPWQPRAVAEYKFGGRAVSVLLLPAHLIDRLVRPRYWTTGGRAADPYDYETFIK